MVSYTFYASLPQYWRHLRPIAVELSLRGHDITVWAQTPGQSWGPLLTSPARLGETVIVASALDAQRARADGRTVVYVEHGAGQTYCLAPRTRILTSDLHWIPIVDVPIGAQIAAFEEYPSPSWRHWLTATVTGRQILRQPTYRLHLSNGTTIDASSDHRWLRYNRKGLHWSRTADLQDAKRWPKRSSKLAKLVDVWGEDRSWGAGYLAAAFDGEGCLNQTVRRGGQNRLRLSFSQRDNEMLREVKAELESRGFRIGTGTTRGGTNQDVAQLGLVGGVSEVLRLLGSVRPRRLLGAFKSLEGRIYASPVELLELEYLGEQTVVGLQTSSGTLVSEGFASHNSELSDPRLAVGYAGGPGLAHVRLFITPSERVSDRWRTTYPTAEVVTVGCPALDDLERHPGPTVAISSHWNCGTSPEAFPALPYFMDAIPALRDELATDGVELVGHAHPRIARRLAEDWKRLGIRFEADPDVILETSRLLIIDNSSLSFEAAAVGLPSLNLNSPRWRRDIHHGLRFWSEVPGLQCDRPEDLQFMVGLALEDGPEAQKLRRIGAHRAYSQVDGRASVRAADAIERLH